MARACPCLLVRAHEGSGLLDRCTLQTPCKCGGSCMRGTPLLPLFEHACGQSLQFLPPHPLHCVRVRR